MFRCSYTVAIASLTDNTLPINSPLSVPLFAQSAPSSKPGHVYAKQYTKSDNIITQSPRFCALLEPVMRC